MKTTKIFVVLSLLLAAALFVVSPVYTQIPDPRITDEVAGVNTPMQTEVTIGVVLYKVDDVAWEVAEYAKRLEVDTWMLPARSPMTRFPGYVHQTKFLQPVKLIVKDAATEAAQVSALKELTDAGVDGIVYAPINGSPAIMQAVQDVLCEEIPVVLVWRDLPITTGMGLKAFVGPDSFRAGWVTAMARIYRRFPEDAKVAVIMADENDPLQTGLAEGFKFVVEDRLADVRVASGNGYDAAKQLIAEYPKINTIFMTDSAALAEGVLQATSEAEERISVSGWGAPGEKYFAASSAGYTLGNIKGVARVDVYEMLVDATTMLKEHLTNLAPLNNKLVTLDTYRGIGVTGCGTHAYTSWPYPYYRGIGGMW